MLSWYSAWWVHVWKWLCVEDVGLRSLSLGTYAFRPEDEDDDYDVDGGGGIDKVLLDEVLLSVVTVGSRSVRCLGIVV